jgi:hypothetical protein
MCLGQWELMWIFLSLPRGLVGHFVPTADPSIIAEELDIIEAIGKSREKIVLESVKKVHYFTFLVFS